MSALPEKVIQGIQSFNQGDFYAAHEFFEDAWRDTPDDSREFYRGLLHLSGGFYRMTQDKPDAAIKFFSRALTWLRLFPNPYLGLNTSEIITLIQSLIAAIRRGEPSEEILGEIHYQIIWKEEPKTS